jgi:hypothetical protein
MMSDKRETFGASQLSLVASAVTMAGQAGWTQRDWEAAQKLEFWQKMKWVHDGDAVVTMRTDMASPKERMIAFYAQVFGLGHAAERALEDLELVSDPNRPDLSATILILPRAVASLKEMLEKIRNYWWQDPIPQIAFASYGRMETYTSNAHRRPAYSYLLHHSGKQESDRTYKNWSHDDALEHLLFMNHEEYILTWAYHKWLTGGECLDTHGSTRLCAKWPEGAAVLVNSSGRRLRLSYCRPDAKHSSAGPREVRFTSF